MAPPFWPPEPETGTSQLFLCRRALPRQDQLQARFSRGPTGLIYVAPGKGF